MSIKVITYIDRNSLNRTEVFDFDNDPQSLHPTKFIKYYTDNIPIISVNENCITDAFKKPKKKFTIYDIDRLLFPFDPIRDWVEKEVKRINEKYAWAEELSGRRALEGRKVYE